MAFTIQQLQDFSNTKPELRWVTEEIIDYLQANPPGGSPSLGYSSYVASITQSGADAPVPIELKNDLFGAWSYGGVGTYSLPFTTPVDVSKIYFPGMDSQYITIFDQNGVIKGAVYYSYDANTMYMNIYDSTNNGIELVALIGGSSFPFPEIRVYD